MLFRSQERKRGIIYSVNSWDQKFYIHTNEDAEDFKIDFCEDIENKNWKPFIPAKDEVLIGGLVFLKNWIIRSETSNALGKLILRDPKTSIEEEIIFSEEIIRYLIETYTNEAGVRKIKEKIEFVSSKNDIDPLETKEWLDSLSAVVEQEGPERAHFLIKQLIDQAYRQGSRIPYTQSTPYINTIPPEEETKSPGDQNIERRLRSLIRWNAAAMVVRANKKFPELGGHIGTFASAATLYDVGMNHFWRAKNKNCYLHKPAQSQNQ